MKTPRIPHSEVIAILQANGCNLAEVNALAIRGYYLDSEGVVGVNDRRVYDDAIALYHPRRGVVTYQANTDPNGYRKGRGTGAAKGMGMLKPSVVRFGTGLHKGKPAFRQCCDFILIRDGDPPYEHKGQHAIDLHSGGVASTSSLGCQTLPAETWEEFRALLYGWIRDAGNELRRNDRSELVRSFDYVLIDETERRKGNVIVPRLCPAAGNP